jgi:large subunit ribosomal protein L6
MSRIGKKPIQIPSGVDVKLNGRHVVVKGPKGQLEWTVVPEIEVEMGEGVVNLVNPHSTKRSNSMWGTMRTVLDNLVIGVTTGFTKTLQIEGTGYRAELDGKTLVMALGFDHETRYTVADDVDVVVTQKPLRIALKGIDKQRVGQVAAEIRKLKKPEPYHGKGIRYEGEYVRRKAGKTGA